MKAAIARCAALQASFASGRSGQLIVCSFCPRSSSSSSDVDKAGNRTGRPSGEGDDRSLGFRYQSVFALLSVVIFGVTAASASGQPWWPIEAPKGTFCASDPIITQRVGRKPVREPMDGSIRILNFERPLERLPRLKQPPISGRLPFGPSSLRVTPTRPDFGGRLRVGKGMVGYRLTNESKTSVKDLDWILISKVFRVDQDGRIQDLVAMSRGRLQNMSRRETRGETFFLSEPGLYRFDITIKVPGDSRFQVGYGDYVRILEPTLDVRLNSQANRFRAGNVVNSRLENFGTELIQEVRDYSVELSTANGWLKVGPTALGWPRSPAPFLSAGKARCLSFRVPSQATPGRYRLVRQVEVGGSLDADLLTLYREFDVTAR